MGSSKCNEISVIHTETAEGYQFIFYLVAFLFRSELVCSFPVYKNLKLFPENVVVYLSNGFPLEVLLAHWYIKCSLF